MTRTRFVALALAGALVAMPLRSAQAEPPPPMPPSNEQRAEQLFKSGETKFDSGRYSEACADFAESLKLGPKLGTLLNVALCHETTGKLATAWSEFHHAAAWAAQNNQKERHDFALSHIQSLETRLPRVVLQLPIDRGLSAIDLDGEPLPEQRWYLPLYLDPGEHALAISAPGKKRMTVSFRVTAAPTDQLVVVPTPPIADRAAMQQPPSVRVDERKRFAGIVALGLGAASVVVGATFGVLAIGASSDARNDDAQTYATVGTVAVLAGAAAATVGGWLFFTSTEVTTPKTAIRSLSVSPVGFSGSF